MDQKLCTTWRTEMTLVPRRCGWAVLLFVLLASSAQAAGRQVVLLQSFDRGNQVLDQFTATLRLRLDDGSDEPVTVAEFVVNPAGFVETPEQAIVDFLHAAFADRPAPDLVITTGGPAAAFAQKYRTRLFPDSPVLYAAVDQRFVKDGVFTGIPALVQFRNIQVKELP